MNTHLSFCIFLDVLGFNELTVSAFKDGTGNELLNNFHKAMTTGVDILNRRRKEAVSNFVGFDIKTFTDNIVLTRNITEPDGEYDLANIIFAVCEFNTHMALSGFFIRGGWALDEIYMDEHMVFGPAVLKAYDLESKYARTPRIALDEKVTDKLKEHLTFYGDPARSPQNKQFLVDADGVTFVNYLNCLIDDYDSPSVIDVDRLNQHRRQVLDNLRKYKDKPKIWAKYQWVASYHNFFIKFAGDESSEQNLYDYLIDERDYNSIPMTLSEKYPNIRSEKI